jgi:Helix-turn-helix.
MTTRKPTRKTLGNILRTRRHELKKSLREFASECNLHHTSLSDFELGVTLPSDKTLVRIVKNLKFENPTTIYNMYAQITGSVPPDVSDYICENAKMIDFTRQIISGEIVL